MYHTHFESETELHVDHDTELTETLADNPVEYTTWAWCSTCHVSFVDASVSLCEGKSCGPEYTDEEEDWAASKGF
jgi:hypothetical protein